MTQIVTPTQYQAPRIVSLAELRSKLLPLCHGNKWAESAIVDLWKLGAPIPQAAHEPERRILLPTQFAAWWDDFNARLGSPLRGRDLYDVVKNKFRSGGGETRSVHPSTRRRR